MQLEITLQLNRTILLETLFFLFFFLIEHESAAVTSFSSFFSLDHVVHEGDPADIHGDGLAPTGNAENVDCKMDEDVHGDRQCIADELHSYTTYCIECV